MRKYRAVIIRLIQVNRLVLSLRVTRPSPLFCPIATST